MPELKNLLKGIFDFCLNVMLLALFIFLFMDANPVFAQISNHQKTFRIRRSPFQAKIVMGSFLDADNTSTFREDGSLIRQFEPMISLSIANHSTTTINAPRLLINNERNWFTVANLSEEVFSSLQTNREKALGLWRFMRDNRIHAASPAHGCNISDPLYLLGVFGYGTCAPCADAVTTLCTEAGLPARKWHLAANDQNHTFAEVDFGDGYVIVDPDAQVFYLDYDNHTLLGKEAVAIDRYLIHRTHHFGKSSRTTFDMTQLYDGFIAESGPSSCHGASLDVNLRPGESIIYRWEEPAAFYHNYRPISFSVPFPVADNQIVYDLPFSSTELSELLHSYTNIISDRRANGLPFIHPATLSEKAELTIKIESPFLLLDSQIIFTWFQATEHNHIALYFSSNGADWQKVWGSSQNGSQQNALNLTSYLNDLSPSQRHEFFLQFKFAPTDSVNACGISAIKVISTFQASRFFMQSLHLGKNIITYSDASKGRRNVEINVAWQESKSNIPPKPVVKLLFPAQNSETESLQFAFKWSPSLDADGDEIVDYHFQLSDRENMAFPLSPNFDIYVSALEENVQPEFRIPWPGLLNDGERYFWRVRALDARGAWSDWSPTWSFVAHGIMPPINGRIAFDDDKNEVLHWRKNPIGALPAYFLIHGSNEPNGFTPDSSNIIGQSTRPEYRTSSTAFSCYRVVAVDSFGHKSGPSRVISIENSSQ
jgi:hypothetical protein